jgi:hypothetical protein
MDPQHFGKMDPHQSEWPDPDRHQSQKQDSDSHHSQNSGAVEAQSGAMEGCGRSQRMRRFALL